MIASKERHFYSLISVGAGGMGKARLKTMSPLYPRGKPCTTGTHNKTVKKMTLFSAFDRSNHGPATALALFNGHSIVRKCDESSLYLVSAKDKSFHTALSVF